MYWEYNVIIYIFLKASLQNSLTLELVTILTIFFCKINNLLTLEDLPQKLCRNLKWNVYKHNILFLV